MPRRVNLPGASELFRPTSGELPGLEEEPEALVELPVHKPASRPRRRATVPAFEEAVAPAQPQKVVEPAAPVAQVDSPPQAAASRRARSKEVTGRVRHDEKITVYVSRDELLALEAARLELRGDYDLAVDRGRIVREAIAIVMADLAAEGENSDLVRRLSGQ